MPNEKLVFSENPSVTIASNKFINVPIILQFDDTPIISIEKKLIRQHSASIPIFGTDGTYLAKYNGSHLFLTKDGEKANLKLNHPQNMDICTLDGKTLFELKRTAAAAINLQVELYTPTGYFIKCSGEENLINMLNNKNESLKISGITMSNCTFQGLDIGLWLKSDGSVSMGCNNTSNKQQA